MVDADPVATLWLIRSTAFDHAQQSALLSMLSAGEVQRHAGFVRPQRQLQFLIGRALLRHAIAATAAVPAPSITITERPGNAPLVAIPTRYGKTPYFSLSHSAHYIACLVSTQTPVGLDIEHTQAQRDLSALTKAAFNEDEQAWLLRQHEDQRQAAFYRLWNCKEALYKLMSGQGKPVNVLPSLIDVDGVFRDSAPDWHCVSFTCDDLFVATCSSTPLQPLKRIDHLHLAPDDLLHH